MICKVLNNEFMSAVDKYLVTFLNILQVLLGKWEKTHFSFFLNSLTPKMYISLFFSDNLVFILIINSVSNKVLNVGIIKYLFLNVYCIFIQVNWPEIETKFITISML